MNKNRTLMVLGLILTAAPLARAADNDLGNMRQQAAAWFKAVNVGGPNGKMVGPISDDVQGILQNGRHAILLIPSDMSKSGKAYYASTWAGAFFAFELTEDQAARAGLKPGSVSVKEGAKRSDYRQASPTAQLDRTRIDNLDNLSADQPISGTVIVQPFTQPTGSLVLRCSYKLPGSTVVVTKPVHGLPGDGVLPFTMDAVNKDRTETFDGPLPLFVDLCVDHGDNQNLEVVSNTIGLLLDVKPAAVRIAVPGHNMAGVVPDFPPAAAPSLVGTRWGFGGTGTTVEFLAGGKFLWSDSATNGFWKQDGDTVTINVNNFTLFKMTLDGDTMTGTWERLKGEDIGVKSPSSLKRIQN